ncbi:hypothetical protein PPYR_02068 [Photinus pyralis]|uniref:DNA-directed DNA polymerase n=1 Tax=Photinus pyralis TaxID=7054 RepID=A0A5N4B6B4_PHOPY|nr:hypothetical protein PPYR_02068 [Photinus pyralis]
MLRQSMLKVNVVLACDFIHPQNLIIDLKTFATKNSVLDVGSNLKEWYRKEVIDRLRGKLEGFEECQSGWSLREVLYVKININKYMPIRVGRFSTYIKIPRFIALKRAVINVRNNDKYCFLWSVVSALYPAKSNPDRPFSYPHFDAVLNRGNIEFPIKVPDIKKFERLNNLAINLYCLEKRNVLPFMLSRNREPRADTINLLVLSSDTNGANSKYYHFAWIKNLSRLLSSQLSRREHAKFFCNICLNHFSSNQLLEKHTIRCHQVNKCAVRLPRESEKIVQFSHYSNKEKVPFAIYADIESILEKCDTIYYTGKNTNLFQRHVPYGIAFYLKCAYDESISKFWSYRGEDCVTWFINHLRSIAMWTNTIINNPRPMERLSEKQQQDFESATHCHICEKVFSENEIRCRDHCHFTSKYRGASHQACNINYQNNHAIPVVFHNLSGYDSHFIIRELATGMPGQIKLLPLNKEKYISFTKYVEGTKVNFRFIDSFRFMSSSIEKLSSYLGNDKKTITRSQSRNESEFNLVIRKGVFPYEYVDSWEKLNETQLPPKDNFFSTLRNEGITDEDYDHALKVWNLFSIQTLGQFSDLYLKTDVLLLADIFENFRETCLQTYKLDPLHYYTAPGLAFDAMLKITEIKLELLTDIDQVMFIEKGIRGGITQCSTRYAKANNKYMKDDYRPDLESIYLMYFDVNSLYGATMCEFLPYGEFSFVDDDAFETLKALMETDYQDYFLVGDSGYPVENYLMTPLLNPNTPAQHLYNEAQIRTRNVVERSYSVWKRRFAVLSLGLRVKLTTTLNIIVATAVLHNIAINMKVINPPPVEVNIENVEWDVAVYEERHGRDNVRTNLIDNYFSHLL